MLFQFMLTTFFKSKLLQSLQKVLSCDQLMQKAYHYKKPLSNAILVTNATNLETFQ